jgi:hypothetical protein
MCRHILPERTGEAHTPINPRLVRVYCNAGDIGERLVACSVYGGSATKLGMDISKSGRARVAHLQSIPVVDRLHEGVQPFTKAQQRDVGVFTLHTVVKSAMAAEETEYGRLAFMVEEAYRDDLARLAKNDYGVELTEHSTHDPILPGLPYPDLMIRTQTTAGLSDIREALEQQHPWLPGAASAIEQPA